MDAEMKRMIEMLSEEQLEQVWQFTAAIAQT